MKKKNTEKEFNYSKIQVNGNDQLYNKTNRHISSKGRTIYNYTKLQINEHGQLCDKTNRHIKLKMRDDLSCIELPAEDDLSIFSRITWSVENDILVV